MSEEAKGSDAVAQPHGTKLMIELGPLLAFFATWVLADIFWATGVLMAATLVSMVASKMLLGRISPSLIATTVLVVFFGSLTLWFGDTVFIQLKPTIVYLLFAAALTYGLYTGRPLLKLLFGQAFNLTEEGWRKLTVRWIGFFFAMAALNEIMRHIGYVLALPPEDAKRISEIAWVNFKAWGVLPLTLVFAMSQIGLIKRYEPKAEV